jgi:hypothetical protein
MLSEPRLFLQIDITYRTGNGKSFFGKGRVSSVMPSPVIRWLAFERNLAKKVARMT